MSPNEIDARVLPGEAGFGTRVNVCTVPTLVLSGQVSSLGSWLPNLFGSPSSEFGPVRAQNWTLPPVSRVARGLAMRPSGKWNRSVLRASLVAGVVAQAASDGGFPQVNGSS